MILPGCMDLWIFTTYSIKIEMDTYQEKSYGTLCIMHSVSKKNTSRLTSLQAIYILSYNRFRPLLERKFLFLYQRLEFIDPKKETTGNLQALLANVYSRGTFNITFEQLDLNENGKIDPAENESLEDQIMHSSMKGNNNYSKMK